MKIYLFQDQKEPEAPSTGAGEGIETEHKAESGNFSVAEGDATKGRAYELPEIFAKLKDRSVHLQDLARREDETAWRPLGEVIQKGVFTLFSATEIDRRQEEAPPASVTVPDFQPIRNTVPSDQSARKKKAEADHSLRPFFAFLILVAVGSFSFSWLKEQWSMDTDASTHAPRSSASKQAAHHPTPAEVQPSSPAEDSAVAEAEAVSPAESASENEVLPAEAAPLIAGLEKTEGTLSSTPSPSEEKTVVTDSPTPTQPTQTGTPPMQEDGLAQPSVQTASQTTSPAEEPTQMAESGTATTTASQENTDTTPPPAPNSQDSSQGSTIAATSPQTTGTIANVAPPASGQPTITGTGAIPEPTPAPPIGKLASGSMDFFKIEPLQFLKKEPKSKQGIWTQGDLSKKILPQFIPCIEARVSTRENTRSDQTYAKAYFFDERNRLISTLEKPMPAGGPTGPKYEAPVIFRQNKLTSLFFAVPEGLKNWKAVVVFGDKYQARTACYPASVSESSLRYPEQALVHHPVQRVARKPAMDPLITHEVKTKSVRQPKITLFLRPPKGVSQAEEIRGVLALSILAGSIEEIRRELQKEELSGDYNGLFGFANKHKLAILAWGSVGLWNPNANYDDLPKEKAKDIKESLDAVADAWEKGVIELSDKYGVPQKDYLLWGECGSAQWAHRLCLRKPDRFLAIAIHNSGSFDKPTPEAAKVLWCVTTGELYAGYERSLRFLEVCQKLGYPITYKALVGVGHSGHPLVKELNFKFFEYAMAQQALRAQHEQTLAKEAKSSSWKKRLQPNQPWIEAFRNPPYYGDIVNQETYLPEQKEQIPNGFQTSLPSKEIAETWAKSR